MNRFIIFKHSSFVLTSRSVNINSGENKIKHSGENGVAFSIIIEFILSKCALKVEIPVSFKIFGMTTILLSFSFLSSVEMIMS